MGLAFIAEERKLIGELVSAPCILWSFENQLPDAALLDASTFFPVSEDT
jgi:hypothetical protein